MVRRAYEQKKEKISFIRSDPELGDAPCCVDYADTYSEFAGKVNIDAGVGSLYERLSDLAKRF